MIRKETFDIIHNDCDYRTRNGFCSVYREGQIQSAFVCSYENCPKVNDQCHWKEKQPLSPEEFADKMLDIFKEYCLEKDDEETAHWEMDVAMRDLLCSLGYEEAVWIFNSTPRWYA